jgi:hypothetical protein
VKTLLSKIASFFGTGATQLKPLPFVVPTGFEVVQIEGFDGRVLKPEGWHHKIWGKGTTLIVQLAKEDLSKENGFITGFTINAVFLVKKQSGIAAEEYARQYIEGCKSKYLMVSEDAPLTTTAPSGQRVCKCSIVADETLELMGEHIPCRLGITTFSCNSLDVFTVMTFGCPREDWEKNLTIYTTIGAHIVIMGDGFGKQKPQHCAPHEPPSRL